MKKVIEVKNLCKSYKELKAIGIDGKTDYIDFGEHLNRNGARKLTAYIGKYLKTHFD